jgi:amidohydrolase
MRRAIANAAVRAGACRIALAGLLATGTAGAADLGEQIDRESRAEEAQVIAWRRDIHQHPELSNREFRTAGLVAEALGKWGIELRTQVAHTGVVGVLRGSKPGPVVALRADMDALPVTEQTGLPYASQERAQYGGHEVGVMHACGHDAHTAMLLGVAKILSGLRSELPGTVVFLFQPAEEKPPPGEEGGARLMLAEGALDDPRPDAVFGLHVVKQYPAGTIAYRAGGAMASSDRMKIAVRGRQTHAAYPWMGVDPIAVASRIVLALHAIPARQTDVRIPSVVSIGSIHGGVRDNIIPERVEMLGTIRSLDPKMRKDLHEKVRRTAEGIAQSAGAEVEVEIRLGYPVTTNDPDLTARMLPTLRRVAAGQPNGRVEEGLPRTGAEDFSYFAEQVPGLYLWLGARAEGVAAEDAAPNHSPRFVIDESALRLGVRALAHLALDTLQGR